MPGEKMKVLIYDNRKQEDEIYDVSTPEKEDAAFCALFRYLDEEWGVYADLAEDSPVPTLCEACSKDFCKGCEDHEDCTCTLEACPSNIHWNSVEKSLRLRWREYYQKAKAGNVKYIRMLMKDRNSRHYEYEQFSVLKVKDATAGKS